MRLLMRASSPLVKLLFLEWPAGQWRMVRDGTGLANFDIINEYFFLRLFSRSRTI